MKKALIIFVRNAELGKVKTRIGSVVGDGAALAIYQLLLNHTMQITADLQLERFVYYADKAEDEDLFDSNIFIKRIQADGDLGDKMESAFTDLFQNGFQQVCIIGSDCMELQSNLIESAFNQLECNDVVIGPAVDGGYYLLGMRNQLRPLFTNISWSSGEVLDQTIKLIKAQQLSYFLLPVLRDVDTIDDLPEQWKTTLGLLM